MVRKMRALAWMLVVTSLTAYSTAGAVNLRWLEYSPVRFFTDRDWEMARETTDKALSSGQDGESLAWENPETGHSGSATVQDTRERDAKKCRSLVLENHAKGMSGRSRYLFCLQPDGEWKIESSSDSGTADKPVVPPDEK